MKDRTNCHGLDLTEEEALGLLEIVMMSPSDLSVEQRNALVKLGEFCRQCLREDTKAALQNGRANASRPTSVYAA